MYDKDTDEIIRKWGIYKMKSLIIINSELFITWINTGRCICVMRVWKTARIANIYAKEGSNRQRLRLKSHSRLRMQSVLSNESWVQILRKFAACSIIARHCQEHNLLVSSFLPPLSPLVSCFPLSNLRHLGCWIYDEKSRSSFVWMHKDFPMVI